MQNENYDWSRFDVYMDIRAKPENVYNAWTTSEGMKSFFVKTFTYTPKGGSPRAPQECTEIGDTYEMMFHHPGELNGRVLEADASGRFIFSFGKSMAVSIELTPIGDYTRIHLSQTEISTDPSDMVMQHLNCRSCWIYYLMNLKSVLEHGNDLRDIDQARKDNIVGVKFHELAIATAATENTLEAEGRKERQ